MRFWNLVALFLMLALLAPFPALAQAPPAAGGPAGNAAIKYWQAFGLLPSMNPDQEKLIRNPNKVPLDSEALKLINRSSMSRLYLHRAASLPRCDWSLDYEDGIRLVLPHLGKSRTLTNLAALHARHEFEHGHWQAGADDITDMLKLARHLEMDRMIFPNLLGYAIESTAIQGAARYLPELKSLLAPAATVLEDTPRAGPTLREMVEFEKQIGALWIIREMKKAEKRQEGGWQAVWKEVFHAPTEGNPADKDLEKTVITFEQAIKLLEDLLPFYDDLAKVAALPWKEFDAQYPKIMTRAKAANPLAGFVLPAINRVAESQRRAMTQRALFKAGLAVVQGGPDKLKDVKDPFGDGPFEYRALDRGFELRSRLPSGGQPLTLVVGQGKKE
jgi:hypothetical protein